MSTTTTLLLNSDNTIDLTDLLDADGVAAGDATVTCTLLLGGDAVTGATDLAMTLVDGTVSTYRGTIPRTVSLVYGNTYALRVTISRADTVGQLEIPCTIVRA